MAKIMIEKNKGNNIKFNLAGKNPRLLMSEGFGKYEQEGRNVEAISASTAWVEHIKSWPDSFDEDYGYLEDLPIYRARPHFFEDAKIIGRLWGAVIIEKEKFEDHLCRLGAYGTTEEEPGIYCTLILDAPKKKGVSKNGRKSSKEV